MAADALCSRVSKFIFLNKGQITEAFLVGTSASKEPSLPTLSGSTLRATRAVLLTPSLATEASVGKQLLPLIKDRQRNGLGVLYRTRKIQGVEAGACDSAYRLQAGQTRCPEVWH